jgi:DNA repair photolyase
MQAPNAGSYAGREQRSERRGRLDFTELRVGSLLRQEADGGGRWQWVINPYQGCGFGCTFCPLRLDREDLASWRAHERQVGVKVNAVEALLRDLRSEDVRGRQVVLGTTTEPWQQAEESFRLTRSILTALTELDGLELKINTRSSLIARDLDLLLQLAAKGRVTVTLSIASLDERVNRLLEPKAPSAFRRLAALEALARAGLEVGLMVAPVMPGLDEDELGLESLLIRAANAGARFAGMRPMQFGPGQRENFLAHVTATYPEHASRFRRIIGRRSPGEDELRALAQTFDHHCQRLGLQPLAQLAAPRPAAKVAAAQLNLFDGALP